MQTEYAFSVSLSAKLEHSLKARGTALRTKGPATP